MTEQKINKSDYTDRKGVVHDSVGENIRSDNNQLSVDYLNSMSEGERNMFPFFPFKNVIWEIITDTITANGYHKTDNYFIYGDNSQLVLDNKVKFIMVIANEIGDGKGCVTSQGTIPFVGEEKFNINFIIPAETSDTGKTIAYLALIEE